MGYFDNQNIATEAVFDPELTTQKMLEVAKTNIDAKITTVDAAVDLENQLSEEAAEFNGMLTIMSNAMHQCEAGEINKEHCLETCAPCVKAIKEKCQALKLSGQSVDGEDITENEIAMLREFIVGCKDLVAAKKEELQDCPITQNAEGETAAEGLMSYINNMEVAEEGLFGPSASRELRKTTEARTANELYNNAKKMYKLGSKDKAVEYMKKAKGLYEKCLANAKKAGGQRKIERNVTRTFTSATKLSDTDKSFNVYKTTGYAVTVAYFEDRVDSCEAYLRKWANKSGKADIESLKKQLKDERKAEKARIKEEKKAAKIAEEAALAEAEAMEGYLDALMLDLQMDAAMESEGDSMIATEAVDIAGGLRNGFNKLKKAVSKGDKAEIEAAQAEIAENAEKLKEADEEADEEGKKKMSTAAKIGLGAAAIAATTAGIYGIGKALKNSSNENIKGSQAAQLIIKASNAIGKGAGAVKGAVTNAGKAVASKFKKSEGSASVASSTSGGASTASSRVGRGERDIEAQKESIIHALKNTKDSAPGTIIKNAEKAKELGITLSAEQQKKVEAARRAMSGGNSSTASAKQTVTVNKNASVSDQYVAMKHNQGVQIGSLNDQLRDMNLDSSKQARAARAIEQLKKFPTDVSAKKTLKALGFTLESYTGGVLGMLVATESDDIDVPLSEVEEDPGKGFNAEAQGEDMIETAEESELDDLAIESAIALFMAEDGIED